MIQKKTKNILNHLVLQKNDSNILFLVLPNSIVTTHIILYKLYYIFPFYSSASSHFRHTTQNACTFFVQAFQVYCLNSIPISSKAFKILVIAFVTSASSNVLSFARNTMEYATDLNPSLICEPS